MPTTSTSRPTTLRRNRTAASLIAIGAVAAIGAAPLVASAAPSTGKLKQPPIAKKGAPAQACAEITPDALRAYPTAFSGKVTKIKDGKVTIAVQDDYRGAPKDRYLTTQGKDSAVDGAPLRFKTGTSYLIAARKNQIITCGVSGPTTPELKRIYTEAFAPMP